jgi:hypothetical protein
MKVNELFADVGFVLWHLPLANDAIEHPQLIYEIGWRSTRKFSRLTTGGFRLATLFMLRGVTGGQISFS